MCHLSFVPCPQLLALTANRPANLKVRNGVRRSYRGPIVGHYLKNLMATPLDENSDRAYTEENLMPGVAGGAAGERVSGGQSHAADSGAVAGVTRAELPFEKPNFRIYRSEKNCLKVQHFLQATSVIIGKKRHRF